ncbi:MAG: VWA domain-containing protein [Acidobacteria bacterium]|nr:MAG: VWA domain-containing protein [Acidobacteriota bacterium]
MTRVVLALTLAAAGAAAVTAQQVIRSGVDLVSLNVTVTSGESFLSGLAQDKFAVYEDGAKQDISFFSAERQPIALSILIDSSTSMDQKLSVAQEAATGFVKRLGDKDVAQVIDFDGEQRVLQTFTNDHAALEKAIRSTTVGGSTKLYNALYVAMVELKKVKAQSADEVRRQAIIVLSDGEDTASAVDYEYVLDAAKRSEVLIYCIGLKSRTDSPTKGFKEADFVLRTLSQETGGRVFFVDLLPQLANVYQTIADELVSQYTIGYSSKNPKRDGAWRTVRVIVDAPDAAARTKPGYYAPTIK